MPKFKKGDRVKINYPIYLPGLPKNYGGSLGTVMEESELPLVLWDEEEMNFHDFGSYVSENSLELL